MTDTGALQTYHRFIDEAGDMTFFGKGNVPLIGVEGVSRVFMLGMCQIKQNLNSTRERLHRFYYEIENDPFFNSIPSVQKRIKTHGFYVHAKDDPPEIRYRFLSLLRDEIKFSVQVVVGRKSISRFVQKHHSNEREFYADLLSHLLKDKGSYEKLVINVAHRGSSTSNNNLEFALSQAHARFAKRHTENYATEIKFNVQPYNHEPLLAIVDYALWTVQRVFERGETRYYNLISDKIPLVLDLYDTTKYEGWLNYYGPKNPLTKENCINRSRA